MNTGMLKLTALAALSTALGVGLTVNNAHADDSTATTNSTTEQVVTSYSQSKQVLDQVTVPSVNAAAVRNTANAQQINYPADYNLDQLSKVNENDANSVQQFDQVAKPGLAQNNYQSDPTAAQQQVDITNLNDQQTYEMNQYAIDLVNQARAHFNEGPFVQNQGTINTVKGMAQQYQDKKESLLTEPRDKWHDESILNGVSENTSAMEIYADNKQVLQSVVRPFATAKGVDFTDNHHIPLFSITNMDDLRAMIFYGVTTMLFNDSGDYYSHAQNFLTLQQPILSMAVYPSIIDGLETAKLSNGQNLTYLVKIVDMHYIWAAGRDNTPGEYGQPNTFETYNNQVYYYGNDGKLYQNQWYNNWGHSYYFKADGARATDEVLQIGNDFYCFDNQGVMQTDHFLTQNGKTYYFGNDGKEYRDRFYTNWGHTYYFGSDGARWDNQWYNNWGHTYYFKGNGVRATSEVVQVGNDFYYFDNQGIMRTDYFLTQNGKVYYFGNDGKEYRDRFYTNWGHTYYFGNDGARYTDQFYNNWGHTYYFGDDGARWDNRFYNNWGHTYYFGSDGARWDNRWMNAWGHSYYFKGDGARATSEVYKIGNDYYYFDNQGIMRTDYFLNQDGKVYYFGSDGKEYRDRFYTNWGHTYYFGSDGARYTNQFYNNWGHTYYFGSDGARWDNRWMNAWGHRYYFKWDGVRATSEYFPVDGETYYFDDQGIAHDDPLVVQWKNLLSSYRGHNAMIAIQSQKDGVVHEYNNNPGHRYTMASTVKVAVLAQLLHNTNGNLTAYQQGLASRMIRNSDNAATTEIVRNYLGGVSRMQELYSALGMTETTPGPGNSWGLTTTTATDQLKLLNEIFMKPQSNYLNDQSRNYIKSLMGSVNADQRWGISAGSSQYYIKNGWLALSAPWPWYVDSIGFIPQDNNNGYTIAVYTDNNIPMQVGVNMIESLARATKSTFNSL